MRSSVLYFILSLSFASSAFATNPNQYRANFWQIHFSANYAGNPRMPVGMVQAHIGEIGFRAGPDGNASWGESSQLVPLQKQNGHFYTTAVSENRESPYVTGGYRGAVIQYHYFLVGEEDQIDKKHPYEGGHWTDVVNFADPEASRGNKEPATLTESFRAKNDSEYSALKATAFKNLAGDAEATTVTEIKWDFAD